MSNVIASVLLFAAALAATAAANNAASPAATMMVDAGTSSPARARHLAAAAADGKCANAGELSPGGVPRVPEGKWGGLTSMHDPTRIVATADGFLFTFSSSAPSGSGCVIDQRFLRPGSAAWEAAGPLFGGCARADAPAWWAADRTAAPDAPTLADADAPSVLYSAAPAFPGPDGALHNFVMYYSKYYQTGDAAATGDEEGAQACIGRATADWKGDGTDNPRALTWVDDGKPVLCSNSKLDPATGAPVARLYPTEAALCAAWGAAGCTFAIDPAVYASADGRLWMAYGSGAVLGSKLRGRRGPLGRRRCRGSWRRTCVRRSRRRTELQQQ